MLEKLHGGSSHRTWAQQRHLDLIGLYQALTKQSCASSLND
ncbi:hypothetical protein SynA1524_02446 [Synechococcus sp. A15-24]|nr:hypothetical protein SynA1524_02446 [Synechococcus sp. A15-24]